MAAISCILEQLIREKSFAALKKKSRAFIENFSDKYFCKLHNGKLIYLYKKGYDSIRN